MFEAKVAEVLNAQLGAWVQGLDAEALKIGVWSGQIVLENLQASATARACAWRSCAPGARNAASRNTRSAPSRVARTWASRHALFAF